MVALSTNQDGASLTICPGSDTTDLGMPDHLRKELDLSHTMQIRWDICMHYKEALLNTYGI